MSKRKRRDDESTPLTPEAEIPPAAVAKAGGHRGAVDRREVRAALLVLLLPLLSQWLQRGDAGVRLVDALILLPSFAVYYGIHRLLYPGRAVYLLLLFLLCLGSAGSDAFAFIGLFAGAAGMLFMTLPALAAGPLYLLGRVERLAAARDYFLAGLRIAGVAAGLFGAAVLPHLLGTGAIPLPAGAVFEAFEAPPAPGLPVVVRRFVMPTGTAMTDVARFIDEQIDRPFFTRALVERSGAGFAFSFRTAFPFFRRGFTFVAEPAEGRFILRVAEGPGDAAGHLLPPAPLPAASLAGFAATRGGLEGSYDPAALTLLSKEMAEDAGLSGDLVFVAMGLEGCMIQVVTSDPGPDVRVDHLVSLFEEVVIRKEHPDFVPRTKERRDVAGRSALVIAGDAEVKGERRRLGFVVVEGEGSTIVTILGTSTLAAADAFDDVFRDFVQGLSFRAPVPAGAK